MLSDLGGKQVEMLHQVVQLARRVAFLSTPPMLEPHRRCRAPPMLPNCSDLS
jgi:hypothetical protein